MFNNLLVLEVLMHPKFVLQAIETKKTNTGRRTIQTEVTRAFIIRLGELNSLPCHSGPGSGEYSPVRCLPNDMTRQYVQ